MNNKILMTVFVASLLLCGLAIWLLQPKTRQEAPPAAIRVEQLPREVLLYFADPEGRYLVAETQQIAGCAEDSDCIGKLFSALAAGPRGELLPILPAQARVLNVELREDLVLVDFNSAFVHAHPGGSLPELLTVYGLVNSLAVNFPYLKQLQILVDGQPVPSLKGHVSLSRPVMADFSYSRAPQSGTAQEQINE
jgi:hypothetical protein